MIWGIDSYQHHNRLLVDPICKPAPYDHIFKVFNSIHSKPKKQKSIKLSKMVKKIGFYFLFGLISLIIFQVSSSSEEEEHILPSGEPLPLLSLRVDQPNLAAATCAYTVKIVTSCSSISHTRDQVSLSFGDKKGNQVYVPRIDDPKSGTFEACSTDTFDISGPCTYDVCYVYLNRRGRDGLEIDSVKISGRNIRTVTFNFKHWLPNNVWFGFNYCNGHFAS